MRECEVDDKSSPWFIKTLRFWQRTNGECKADSQTQSKVSRNYKALGIKVQLDSGVVVFCSTMGES